MAVGLAIEGLDELQRQLTSTLPKEARALVRGAVGAAASAVRKDLKATAPKRRGTLRRAFFVKRNRGKPDQISADVRARPTGFYWHFLEKGTKKMRARPFREPVLERMRDRLPALFRNEVGKRLEKIMARKRNR